MTDQHTCEQAHGGSHLVLAGQHRLEVEQEVKALADNLEDGEAVVVLDDLFAVDGQFALQALPVVALVAGMRLVAVDGGEHQSVAGEKYFVAPQAVHDGAQTLAQRSRIHAFGDDGQLLGTGEPAGAQPAVEGGRAAQLHQGVEACQAGGEHHEPQCGEQGSGEPGLGA